MRRNEGRKRALRGSFLLGLLLAGTTRLAVAGEEALRGEESSPVEVGSATSTAPGVEFGPPKENLLPSGLRVVSVSAKGMGIEVCSAHRIELAEQERASLHLLAEILARGGFRTSTDDYSGLLDGRDLTTEVTYDGNVVSFCTKGPAKELPLALWVTRGRFARQALTEKELGEARVRLRGKASAKERASEPKKRALSRFEQMRFGARTGDLSLPTTDEERSGVGIDGLRALHERVFFGADTVVSVAGSFGEPVLERVLGEQLLLPKALSSAQPNPSAPQRNYRYGLVEDERIGVPEMFVGNSGSSEVDATAAERELGTYLLGLKLASLAPSGNWEVERVRPDEHLLSARAADVKDLEKRREELTKTVASFAIRTGELARAIEWREEARRRELALAPARTLALRALHGESIATAKSESGPAAARVTSFVQKAFRPEKLTTVELLPKGFSDPFEHPDHRLHVVEAGETLGSIAYRYRISPEALEGALKTEGVLASDGTLRIGATIRLPGDSKGSRTRPPIRYRVQKGDTLASVASKHQLRPEEIISLNQLTSPELRVGEYIYVGHYAHRKSEPLPRRRDGVPVTPVGETEESEETFPKETSLEQGARSRGGATAPAVAPSSATPKRGATRGATVSAPPASSTVRIHLVEPGDSLGKIAKRYGVDVSDLCAWNSLDPAGPLFVGRRLRLAPPEDRASGRAKAETPVKPSSSTSSSKSASRAR